MSEVGNPLTKVDSDATTTYSDDGADQLAGRFLSRDPLLQTAGGQVPNGNLYIYPGNSPVVVLDPSGS